MKLRKQNVTLIYNDDFSKRDINTSLSSIQKGFDNITLTVTDMLENPNTDDQAAIKSLRDSLNETNKKLATTDSKVEGYNDRISIAETNSSSALTKAGQIEKNYVTTDTEQTISAKKTSTAAIEANSFIKTDGTNEQVLLADGTTINKSDIKGTKGDKGDKGDIGPEGPKGDTGPAGSQGPRGPMGQGLPIGSIIPYAGATIPNGYILCDGRKFDVNVYKELRAVLGKDTVPDLRDRFVMGAGRNGRGAYVSEGIPNISGGTGGLTSGNDSAGTDAQFGNGWGVIRNQTKTGPGSAVKATGWQIQNGFDFYANRSNGLYGASSHIQPASYVSYYMIKALYVEETEVPPDGVINATTVNITNRLNFPGIYAPDTRNDNQNPAWYMRERVTKLEFKNTDKIGVKGLLTGTYCTLMTVVPWGDSSGTRPVQVAFQDTNKIAMRSATSDTAWGGWKLISTQFSLSGTTLTITN